MVDATMTCRRCGAAVVHDDAFCRECGAPLLALDVDPDFDLDATLALERRTGTWYLETADGVRHPIRSQTVIGRSPARGADHRSLGVLAFEDSSRSLSKTHALVEPTDGGFYVQDLGSTNGTMVSSPDGEQHPVAPGERVRLDPGGVLELGEFILTVVRR
jgi:pSer/pThr/pTyr-binding forkhead associated (FHA) protein